MIRSEVKDLVTLGAFPASSKVESAVIMQQEQLLRRITPPISDAEARELVNLFGPDEYYGLAWTVLHLIEGAPHWPLLDCISETSNEWIARLKIRVEKNKKEKEEGETSETDPRVDKAM